MAAFANVTINDGLATPVAHVFTTSTQTTLPDGTLRFNWLDFSVNGGVPLGANRLSMDVRMPSFGKKKAGVKAGDTSNQLAVSCTVVLPTMEALSNNTASGINPQPTWAYDTTVWWKVVRNGRAGAQPVKDALAFMRNFSQLAVYTDAVLTFSPPGG